MQFSKDVDEEIGISLTSLIDVIFLLLIFFMVATTLVDPSRKLNVQLPEAKSATADNKAKPVVIEMDDNARITLNGQDVDLNVLEARLNALGQEGNNAAILRADRRLDYGRVVEVLGISRAAGFQDIGIAVR
ncbi:MAG: biopolymer transporter ExbD [Deltaproteobacteria bacterium]|nr:biopolymer transporter ExbD [Deltaproteobacteria bacterium]